MGDSRRWGSREAIGGLCNASGVSVVPIGVQSGDLAIFPASRHTLFVVIRIRPSSCYAGAGLGRSPSISHKIFWTNFLGTAILTTWKMT